MRTLSTSGFQPLAMAFNIFADPWSDEASGSKSQGGRHGLLALLLQATRRRVFVLTQVYAYTYMYLLIHIFVHLLFCICIHIYIYIYMCKYVYIYIYVYVSDHTYLHIHTYAHTHVHVYVCTYTCVHRYVHMYMYIEYIFRYNWGLVLIWRPKYCDLLWKALITAGVSFHVRSPKSSGSASEH